jgi:integrase
MAQQVRNLRLAGDAGREVIPFEGGVVAYGPTEPGGYWRLRWLEFGRRRDTTARTRDEALTKAVELSERLNIGTPTSHLRARGDALVEHYLDRRRRPTRGTGWSQRHREEQAAYCRRFVLPVITDVLVRDLRPQHFQRVVDTALTASVAAHLRTCLSAMVAAGLEEGLLLARQDVLRGVRWTLPRGEANDELERGVHIDEAEIPTARAVHALARAAAEISHVWWRELEILLVAYSGLRWGEHAALTADRLEPVLRRIVVDRQVIETRHHLALSPPKNRRRRATMYPARTPEGVELSSLVARRLRELRPEALVFPAPRGAWARRSNYRRNVFDPAATAAAWPRRPDGRWVWTFHSLRHVFATWALAQPGARIEDVSRLMGHSSVRITQDIYVSPDGDLFERFFELTK